MESLKRRTLSDFQATPFDNFPVYMATPLGSHQVALIAGKLLLGKKVAPIGAQGGSTKLRGADALPSGR